MTYKGILFDFNGVLLWDTLWHDEAWRQSSKLLRGIALSDEEMSEFVHGRTNTETFMYLLGKKPGAKELQEHTESKEKMYQDIAVSQGGHFSLSPGAEKLLNLLKENNVPRTIATSAPWINVDFYIKHLHLEKWFDVERIVYDDGNHRSKPAPDMYLEAAEKIHIPIAECIVIEDSGSGIQAAVNAGAGKIIGLGPKEKHDKLRALGANKTVETLTEVSLEDLRD